MKCKTHDDNEEIIGKLYSRSSGKVDIDETANLKYNPNSGIREPAFLSAFDENKSYNYIGLTLEKMQTDYKNMIISVFKYG